MARQRKGADTERATAGGTHVEGGTTLDVDSLQKIVEILEASEVTRLVWKNGSERLYIRRSPPRAQVAWAPAPMSIPSVSVTAPAPQIVHAQAAAPVAAPAAPAAASEPPRPSIAHRPTAPATPAPEKKGHVITSPFVGTFYRSPAPDQPSFVDVGSTVKKGQVLCIVEAMKLMNEIESETDGKIAEILVENGQPVEFGQPLFRIEKP